MKKKPRSRVGIIMGSKTDAPSLQRALDILKDFSVPYELKIVSAHRTPKLMMAYAESARSRGLEVIIAAAGGAAHLPGMVASLTTLPVLGVPVNVTKLNGLDSILSILQMPEGVPVGTLGLENSGNAALLALRIMSIEDPVIAKKLEKFRKAQAQKVKRMQEDL